MKYNGVHAGVGRSEATVPTTFALATTLSPPGRPRRSTTLPPTGVSLTPQVPAGSRYESLVTPAQRTPYLRSSWWAPTPIRMTARTATDGEPMPGPPITRDTQIYQEHS